MCYVGANEEVLAISIYEGKIIGRMNGPEDLHQSVTCLALGKSRPLLAVGYADGSVLIYNPESYKMTQKYSFHTSAVTALCFDKDVIYWLI